MASGRTKLSELVSWAKPNADWCIEVADYYNVPVTVTSVWRSWEEQDALYKRWLNGGSVYPANPPGQSAHEYRMAWDSTVDPVYQGWWDYVRELAGFYVPSNDRIHAAVPDWRSYVG